MSIIDFENQTNEREKVTSANPMIRISAILDRNPFDVKLRNLRDDFIKNQFSSDLLVLLLVIFYCVLVIESQNEVTF